MRQEFAIKIHGEVLRRPGLPTPFPGLAIIDTGEPDYPYSLTHLRTGASLVSAESPEALAAALPDLAGVDWTRAGSDLQADPLAVGAWNAARSRPGLDAIGPRSDGRDLRDIA